jgi:hypothetical protein
MTFRINWQKEGQGNQIHTVIVLSWSTWLGNGAKKGPLQGNRLGNLPTDRVSICIVFFFFFGLGFMVADVRVYLNYPKVRNLIRIVIAFDKDYITMNLGIWWYWITKN